MEDFISTGIRLLKRNSEGPIRERRMFRFPRSSWVKTNDQSMCLHSWFTGLSCSLAASKNPLIIMISVHLRKITLVKIFIKC